VAVSATSCHAVSPPVDAPAARPRVLLVGRPNCGKSSLFNAVTGGHARVGNYPGVTVDILERDLDLVDGQTVRMVDLPGTYSVEAGSDPDSDEGITRAHIERARAGGAPVVLAQVLDVTSLAAGLRLTGELLRLGLPLLLVISHRDEFEAEGLAIDLDVLRRATACPTVWVSARSASARAQVLAAIAECLTTPAAPALAAFVPDTVAARMRGIDPARRKDARDTTPPTALGRRTERLDRALMHVVAGPIAFLAAMGLLFVAVFVVADPVSALMGRAVDACSASVRGLIGQGRLSSFLCSGVLGGAGTVLQFLPQIVLLTLALDVIEASGYLARGAFLTDRLLRFAGLGGRSFVPLLIAHGCAVPAITATRTIRDPRQRLKTMLVLPLMTCSARIPAYALIIATFFPGLGPTGQAAAFLTIYVVALLAGGVASVIIDRTVMKGRRLLPLVLELPPYRLPQIGVLARVAWQTSLRFIRDVGTVIVLMSALLWALLSLPMPGGSASASASQSPVSQTSIVSHSIAAGLGHALDPVTRPLGFDWHINVGLIAAFGAREMIVSTMGVIYGLEDPSAASPSALAARMRVAVRPDGRPAYSVATGLSLIAFFLVACQCMSTVAAIRRETRTWRWPLFVLAYSYAAAFALALLVHTAARICHLG